VARPVDVAWLGEMTPIRRGGSAGRDRLARRGVPVGRGGCSGRIGSAGRSGIAGSGGLARRGYSYGRGGSAGRDGLTDRVDPVTPERWLYWESWHCQERWSG
jgi:hypothetical protein